MSFGPDPNLTEDKGKACDCLGAGFRSVPLSLLGEQCTNKAVEGWGMVSLCPEAHLIWRTEKQRGTSKPSLKHQSRALLGGGEPWELHVITSISLHSWVEMPWSRADTQISLLGVSISHTEPSEPDLRADLNCANHPPHSSVYFHP